MYAAYRSTLARRAAAELNDLQLGAILMAAHKMHAARLEDEALTLTLADAFDACEALSVAAGDIKPAETDESTDEDAVLFRWRRGARTALRACRGEGNLLSAADTGRLVRLKLAGG